MAQSPIPALSHPGVRRSVTLPPSLQNNHEKGSSTSDAVVETLLQIPVARIVSFSASTGACKAVTACTPEVAGTIPWTSTIEKLEAAGPLRLYRVPGSLCFVESGGFLLSLFPRSQCWCVDGVSKFAMMLKMVIYRIEIPSDTTEDMQKVEEFKLVLNRILHYEKTPCPFKRSFSEAVTQETSPATPRRTRIPAASSSDASPALKRSTGSARRARKWEFDEVWRPEGYVKQSPSVSPQIGFEESDGDNSSSQELEDGSFSRKTSTTSRTDTEPSSPGRVVRPEKSRSVTAPPGLLEQKAAAEKLPERRDRDKIITDVSCRDTVPSPDLLQQEGALEGSDPATRPSDGLSTNEEAEHSVEKIVHPIAGATVPAMVSAYQQRHPERSSPPRHSEHDTAASTMLDFRDNALDSSANTSLTPGSSKDSYFNAQPTPSASSLQNLQASSLPEPELSSNFTDRTPGEEDTQQRPVQTMSSPHRPDANAIESSTSTSCETLTTSNHSDTLIKSPLAEPSHQAPASTRILPPSVANSPPSTTIAVDISASPTVPQLTSRPPSPIRPTSKSSINDPHPDTAQAPTPLQSRQSPTLNGAPLSRINTPPSPYPSFKSRRPSSPRPSSDLTNSLISRTCALLRGPPSGLVAIMMQIAARVASGAMRTSQAFRVTDGKLGYVPGQWEDGEWGSLDGAVERENEGVQGEREEDISSESDLFDDLDDEDNEDGSKDVGISTTSGSPATVGKGRWNLQLEEHEELD